MKVVISKLQWEGIGRVAGWMREAMVLDLDLNKSHLVNLIDEGSGKVDGAILEEAKKALVSGDEVVVNVSINKLENLLGIKRKSIDDLDNIRWMNK